MILKTLRIIFAVAMLAAITLFFFDWTQAFLGTAQNPDGLTVGQGSWLEKIQFFPALLHHAHWVVLAILAVTFLFGRLYCSVICPLGILQDFISWLSKRMPGGKKYRYKKPLPLLRWAGVLVAFGAGYVGLGFLFYVIEPYSIFGRIANGVFRPVYILINNSCLVTEGSLNFSRIAYSHAMLSVGSFCLALGSLAVIGILAWRSGRTWCNTICPVGTILGLLSRFSLFRIRIDASRCKSCGMCAQKCKSSCMNTKGKAVDASRCVDCFNCLGSCKFDALTYSIGGFLPAMKGGNGAEGGITHKSDAEKAQARRDFLITTASMAASVPVVAGTAAVVANTVMVKPQPDKVYKSGQHAWTRQTPVAPPGAGSIGHLLHHCTACHLCVAKCPQHVLKPAFLEYGVKGMFAPVMDFTNTFCNYDCTVCSEVCPNGAINILGIAHRMDIAEMETPSGDLLVLYEDPEKRSTPKETPKESDVPGKPERKMEPEKTPAEQMRYFKNRVQMGRVRFVEENCVVAVDGTFCGACDEHCPTKAVSMVPYGDPEKGLTIPHVDESICIGCGGCESICPARPYKAIYVEGCERQGLRDEFNDADTMSEEEVKEKTGDVDDWLFD